MPLRLRCEPRPCGEYRRRRQKKPPATRRRRLLPRDETYLRRCISREESALAGAASRTLPEKILACSTGLSGQPIRANRMGFDRHDVECLRSTLVVVKNKSTLRRIFVESCRDTGVLRDLGAPSLAAPASRGDAVGAARADGLSVHHRTTLTATGAPEATCLPPKTSPVAPAPILASSSKSPRCKGVGPTLILYPHTRPRCAEVRGGRGPFRRGALTSPV